MTGLGSGSSGPGTFLGIAVLAGTILGTTIGAVTDMLGIGILLIGVGALSSLAITALGVVVTYYAVWGWALEPTD